MERPVWKVKSGSYKGHPAVVIQFGELSDSGYQWHSEWPLETTGRKWCSWQDALPSLLDQIDMEEGN